MKTTNERRTKTERPTKNIEMEKVLMISLCFLSQSLEPGPARLLRLRRPMTVEGNELYRRWIARRTYRREDRADGHLLMTLFPRFQILDRFVPSGATPLGGRPSHSLRAPSDSSASPDATAAASFPGSTTSGQVFLRALVELHRYTYVPRT